MGGEDECGEWGEVGERGGTRIVVSCKGGGGGGGVQRGGGLGGWGRGWGTYGRLGGRGGARILRILMAGWEVEGEGI